MVVLDVVGVGHVARESKARHAVQTERGQNFNLILQHDLLNPRSHPERGTAPGTTISRRR